MSAGQVVFWHGVVLVSSTPSLSQSQNRRKLYCTMPARFALTEGGVETFVASQYSRWLDAASVTAVTAY